MKPSPHSDPRIPPRRFGRARTALVRSLERAARLAGGRAFYRRRHLAPGRFVVRREDVRVPGLPADLDGLTVAHLGDLHAGPFLGQGDLEPVVAATRAAEPDLVCITGDLITHRWSDALVVLDELASLRPPLGAFAVFGNHDYRGREEGRIAAAYLERGIRFLRNEGVRVAVGAAHVALVGIEDPEEGRVVDVRAARAALEPEDVEIALCHGPRGAPALAREGCAVVLAGHTHGRQVALPWLERLGPAHPGLRVDLGPTTLIVTRGLGVVGVPIRVGAPAEVVLVRLRPVERNP